MINLSISVDSSPQKKHAVSEHNIVYISATFSNDLKAREFVEKVFSCFKYQNTAVLIEDPTSYEYKKFFHNSNLLEFGNTIIALDADNDDVINVISNWCYYEIGISIYIMENDSNSLFLNKENNNFRLKKRIVECLQQNSSVIISQELDYTVNVRCRDEVFDSIFEIIKNETFKM